MAEALARQVFGATDVRVQSAGSKPSWVHPLAIAAMTDAGIGMAGQTSKAVADVDVDSVDLVITLCADEVCPVAMGQHQRLHWPLPDPDRPQETLTDAERLAHCIAVRDQIRGRLEVLAALREAPGTQGG